MDVLTIPKTKDQFRVLYDVKGRFTFVKLTKDKDTKVIFQFRIIRNSRKSFLTILVQTLQGCEEVHRS